MHDRHRHCRHLCSSLQKACKNSHVDCLLHLLEGPQRHQLSDVDKNGMSPLMVASFIGCPDIVKAIVKNGANINQCKSDGWTALELATKRRKNGVVKVLLENGARTDFTDAHGDTILHRLCNKEEIGRFPLLKLFLSHFRKAGVIKEYINAKNKDGVTPLMLTAENCNINSVAMLVNAGADVNICSKENKTACHYAEVYTRTRDYLRKRTDKALIRDLIDQENAESETPTPKMDNDCSTHDNLKQAEGTSNNNNNLNCANCFPEDIDGAPRSAKVSNDDVENPGNGLDMPEVLRNDTSTDGRVITYIIAREESENIKSRSGQHEIAISGGGVESEDNKCGTHNGKMHHNQTSNHNNHAMAVRMSGDDIQNSASSMDIPDGPSSEIDSTVMVSYEGKVMTDYFVRGNSGDILAGTRSREIDLFNYMRDEFAHLRNSFNKGLARHENKLWLNLGAAHKCVLELQTPLLAEHQDIIKQELNPDEDLLAELVSFQMVSLDEKALILREITHEGKVNLLIDFVDRHKDGEVCVYIFIDVLSRHRKNWALGQFLDRKWSGDDNV